MSYADIYNIVLSLNSSVAHGNLIDKLGAKILPL